MSQAFRVLGALVRVRRIDFQVPNRYQDDDRITPLWRRRRVDAGRDIDVKAGLIWYQVLLEDAIKTFLVVFGEKDVVGA